MLHTSPAAAWPLPRMRREPSLRRLPKRPRADSNAAFTNSRLPTTAQSVKHLTQQRNIRPNGISPIRKDGLLFVSEVTRTTSTAPGVDPPPPPPPVTYYWDNNGITPGFGSASGVWGETTSDGANQGWSEDATGGVLPRAISPHSSSGQETDGRSGVHLAGDVVRPANHSPHPRRAVVTDVCHRWNLPGEGGIRIGADQ